IATITICAALMIAPWLIKNWVWVQNPVAPFFNSVFPNPYIHISFEKEYRQLMRDFGELKSSIPVEVAIRGGLGGVLGPVFLLAPLSLFALRYSAGRQLLLAAVVFGSTYAANVGTRFLIPCVPYLALAMGLVFTAARGIAPLLILAQAFASWPSI